MAGGFDSGFSSGFSASSGGLTLASTTPTTYDGSTASTSHSVTLPSTSSGDHLIMFATAYGSSTVISLPYPWQQIDDGEQNGYARGNVFWRKCDGSVGSTVTATLSVARQFSAHTFKYTGSGNMNLRAPRYAYATSSGATTTPDPPSCSPSYGSEWYDSFAYVHHSATQTSLDASPSGYSGGTYTGGTSGEGAVTITAVKTGVTAASEDPGTFTIGTARTCGQWTVMVPTAPPASIGGSGYPTLEDVYFDHLGSTSSPTANLPSINGKGCIVILSCRNNPTITAPTGWSTLWSKINTPSAGSAHMAVYRQGDGGANDACAFSLSAAQQSQVAVFIMSDVDLDTAAPDATTGNHSTASTADPPSHTPSGGSDDYLWLTGILGLNETDMATPATNYEAYRDGFLTNSVYVYQFVGFRTNTASSEDPAAFTINPNREQALFTAAVPPSSGQSVSVTAASETESAQTVGAITNQSVTVSAVSESESAVAVAVVQGVVVSVSTASETEAAIAVSVETGQIVSVSVVSETETAEPIGVTFDQSTSVAVTSETEAAGTVSADQPQTIDVTGASETETATSMGSILWLTLEISGEGTITATPTVTEAVLQFFSVVGGAYRTSQTVRTKRTVRDDRPLLLTPD